MLNFKSWAVIHAVMIKNASMEIPWWSNDSVLMFQGHGFDHCSGN